MEEQVHCKRRSGSFLPWLLIIIGIALLLKHSGWDINFPGIGEFFSGVFHFIGKIGWPLFLIIAGVILLTGRRIIGTLILIIALLFILPHFIIIPGILLILFFPIILLIVGIAILAKLF